METEKLFITGFNNGYLIAKYEPALSLKIKKNMEPAAGYLEGFISGTEEYELEKSQVHMDDLDQLRNISKGRDQELEKE